MNDEAREVYKAVSEAGFGVRNWDGKLTRPIMVVGAGLRDEPDGSQTLSVLLSIPVRDGRRWVDLTVGSARWVNARIET